MQLTFEQKFRAEQMTSFFENSTIKLQYSYAEHLPDGRGITAGRAGFTTGTFDAHIVVKRYTEKSPNNLLAKFLPELERLDNAENKGETKHLRGYIKAWKLAAKDEIFRQAQDEISDELYFHPSQKHADECGLQMALSRAVLYDSIIQHGDEGDFDSLSAMLKRTAKALGGTPQNGVDEKIWLTKFLEIRRKDLLNPANKETQKVWAESVGRIDVLQKLLADGNFNLSPPMKIQCFGDSVTIL